MEQTRYYVLPEHDFNMMRWQLQKAIRYCQQAGPIDWNEPELEHTYPGATGYSQSAMEDTLHRLDALHKTVVID